MKTTFLCVLQLIFYLSMSSDKINTHTKTLNILTWNVRGVISSCNALINVIDTYKCDIAILSEHKLALQSYSFLETMHEQYLPCPNISNNYTSFINDMNIPLVAILIKKDLMFSITEIQNINNNRIVGIELKSEDNCVPLYIFGVYLPADGDLNKYNDCIDKMDALYNY